MLYNLLILVSVWLLPKVEPETRIWGEEIYLRRSLGGYSEGVRKRDKAGRTPTHVHVIVSHRRGLHPTSDSLEDSCVKGTSELS